MAILKIAKIGHPVLRKKSREVGDLEIKSNKFQSFLDDLVMTMREFDGVGISAPQVHESLRVLALECENNPRYPDKERFPLEILVNPKIIEFSEDKEEDWEGCLSVDLRGMVLRSNKIRFEGIDRKGRLVKGEAKGFKARVIQHEVDHLDGVLFIDRVRDLRTLTALKEFEKYWKISPKKRPRRSRKSED